MHVKSVFSAFSAPTNLCSSLYMFLSSPISSHQLGSDDLMFILSHNKHYQLLPALQSAPCDICWSNLMRCLGTSNNNLGHMMSFFFNYLFLIVISFLLEDHEDNYILGLTSFLFNSMIGRTVRLI